MLKASSSIGERNADKTAVAIVVDIPVLFYHAVIGALRFFKTEIQYISPFINSRSKLVNRVGATARGQMSGQWLTYPYRISPASNFIRPRREVPTMPTVGQDSKAN